MSKRDEKTAATAWLACDLAELADDLNLADHRPHDDAPDDMDVVIVGSGYGASMALDELAGCTVDGAPLRIAMLERGREYAPGAFPSSEADLAGHARFSTAGTGTVRGEASGLFDLRLGPDVNVLLANGLGGGSLINAGVMAPPLEPVFADPRWPQAVRAAPPSAQEFEEARTRLMAVSSTWSRGRNATMNRLARAPASDGSAGSKAAPVHITVADADDLARGIRECISCGDCATGCNFNAKISVDVSLIANARRRHARDHLAVVTGATVVDVRRRKTGGWELEVIHTESGMRRHQRHGYLLRTRRVIIAAGTLGSTELLMRARESGLAVSPRLGAGFSTNGDMISLVCGTPRATNAVADEHDAFAHRHQGPTITRMIDRRDDAGLGAVIQDLGVPGPLRRLFEESATTGLALGALTRKQALSYRRGATAPDPAGIDRELIQRSLAVAVIGDDDATGRLTFPASTPRMEQGTLGVVWPELRNDPRQEARQDAFEALARASIPKARVVANPAWHPLGRSLEAVFGKARGPAITVHPLGGCAMGDSFDSGVVDSHGQVFDGTGGVHDGLVVLDGSIVPMALGINPALTISTLALRAIRALRTDWKLIATAGMAPVPLSARPQYAIPTPVPTDTPTTVSMTERMTASLSLSTSDGPRPFAVDLELWFKPIAVRDLVGSQSSRVLVLDDQLSRLVIQHPHEVAAVDIPIDRQAASTGVPPAPTYAVAAPLAGTLTLFRHDTSVPLLRTLRALGAWAVNRGIRELFQRFADVLARRPRGNTAGLCSLIASAWRLASQAGDVRMLEYALTLGNAEVDTASGLGVASDWTGRSIRAHKRLTYEVGGNPVRQLMEAAVDAFPGAIPGTSEARLTVDATHFGHTGIPLVRIVQQRNSPSALLDLASLGAYIARVLLPLHLWYLRLPDRSSATPRRLPADLARKRPFAPLTITELRVDQSLEAGIVNIRLSRYRPDVVRHLNPVLLLHGYSASGTTFVHETLPGGGLVGALCAEGHDVWVLDMRSSSGMPTAQVRWKFEQMGCNDIPVAVNHILESTGAAKVDIVAHCMGATMLTLGLMLPLIHVDPRAGLNAPLTKKMREHIGRLVFSQAGPVIVARPANVARSYVFQWVRHYLRLGAYEFTPSAPGVADDMLDRLLSAVPYPARDFARENPRWRPWKRTPWVGARHRMDALYGITFDLAGLDDAVLDRIDDFFGPLNVETVAQVIAFARANQVSDAQGNATFNAPQNFARYADSPVLSLHATENGLFDFATRELAAQYFDFAGLKGRSVALEGFGHQDSLIGRNAPRVYQLIVDFLR